MDLLLSTAVSLQTSSRPICVGSILHLVQARTRTAVESWCGSCGTLRGG
uniref:Uncharacterized protein n=1 Tax=Manihot esculenta TaxID=3983 RepID=A0A2C9UJB9_MANES